VKESKMDINPKMERYQLALVVSDYPGHLIGEPFPGFHFETDGKGYKILVSNEPRLLLDTADGTLFVLDGKVYRHYYTDSRPTGQSFPTIDDAIQVFDKFGIKS